MFTGTNSSLEPVTCNFEKSLCGWYQDLTDEIDWKLGSLSDHTTGQGKFAKSICFGQKFIFICHSPYAHWPFLQLTLKTRMQKCIKTHVFNACMRH